MLNVTCNEISSLRPIYTPEIEFKRNKSSQFVGYEKRNRSNLYHPILSKAHNNSNWGNSFYDIIIN